MGAKRRRKPGRPRMFESPEDFDVVVDTYIDASLKKRGEPITWTGLALALGFTSREALDHYATYPEFSDSVKRAKALVERSYEGRLHHPNPGGAIFVLKNMGWSDRIEHSGPQGGPIPTTITVKLIRSK